MSFIPGWALQVPLDQVLAGLDAIRRDNGAPEGFSAEVLAEARQRAAAPDLPAMDLTRVPFATLDPESSRDLDQAFRIERKGAGFRVLYAIADVPAFVLPGGALDAEVRRRGETVYCPDTKIPLHPVELSEGAASLLPGQTAPAFVWQLDLDSDGGLMQVELVRALVRSRAKLSYEQCQRDLDRGVADEQILLLRDVGERRIAQEIARGGVDLPAPEQQLGEKFGRAELVSRIPDPVERWNAQISLLTGMAAAAIMLSGGVGILRTMPSPQQRDTDRLRRAAKAFGIAWPKGATHAAVIRTVDAHDPKGAAFLNAVPAILRGSDYVAFDGTPPVDATHSGIGGPYTHVTAPLRRLVDRYGLLVCHALASGSEIPADVRAALPGLPQTMRDTRRRTRAIDRACIDYLEAVRLMGLEGQVFRGVIVEQKESEGTVTISEPAVVAPCSGRDLPLGEWVDVRLVQADPDSRRVRFELA